MKPKRVVKSLQKSIKKVARKVQPKKKKPAKKPVNNGILLHAKDGELNLIDINWEALVKQFKDDRLTRLLGSAEARKLNKFYQILFSKLNISCNCGNLITSSEFGNNFHDLTTAAEKALTDSEGNKKKRLIE